MTPLVHITMFGYPLVVLLLFMLLPARRAVIVGFLAGWLFLPNAGYGIEGLPAYTKMSACCVAPMLGAALFDLGRITSFRPRWFDLPILLWCICPLFSSLSNQLGLYDGLSGVFRQTVTWGLPYFMGRVYMGDLSGLRSLAVALFVAGLIYVPLCLYEMRMSPQLHSMLYGFHYRGWGGRRLGGFRPLVFLETGLTLGLWMTACTLTGVWLWARGAVRRLWGIPVGWLAGLLLAVTVLCRSTGALALLGLGLAAMFAAKWTRTRAPILALLAIAPVFILSRASGLWSGSELVDLGRIVSEERASSIQTRIDNDDRLVEKALRRWLFGWGAWGRYRVRNERGRDITLADSFWTQAVGKNGLVGLASLAATLLLPAIVLTLRYPAKLWWSPSLAPATALATVSVLFMLDSLLNAMENPVFVLAVGGVSGFCAKSWRPAAARGVALAERAEPANASLSASVLEGRVKCTNAIGSRVS